MPKLLSLLDRLLTQPAAVKDRAETAWVLDPLRHPEIARMDLRELGDLPFPSPVPQKTASC